MKRQTAIIWVWGLVLIAGAVGGGFVWWRQQDVAQAYEAGRAAADADRWEDALTLAQPYADRDDPRINGLLADAYINGPASIQNIDKGLTLRRRAAEAGDMRAAYFLGRWILEHEPTEAQAQEAIGFLQNAADCGMPSANYDLGVLFADGVFIDIDIPKSIQHSEAAALASFESAAWNAAIGYARLAGQDESFLENESNIKMLYWFFWEAKNGNPEAQRILEVIEDRTIDKFNEYGELWIQEFHRMAVRWVKKIHPANAFTCNTIYQGAW